MDTPGTLVFFCGKMGAGKSTKATSEAQSINAVLLSEDEWLQSLYPGAISTLADYLTYSKRIKPLVEKTVVNILSTGTNVVMDFPANTRRQRQWLLTLADNAGSEHLLFYLDINDKQCLKQIAKRRSEQPERAAFDTETTFRELGKYFEKPDMEESLNIELVKGNSLQPGA